MADGGDIRAGRAYVELTLQNSKFLKGLRAASDRLKSFGRGVATFGAGVTAAGAAITGPLLAAVTKFAEVGSRVQRVADRIGTSVEAFSELSHAAAKTGVDVDLLGEGLTEMVQRLGEAAQTGTGSAADMLKLLGLEAKKLVRMKPEESFARIADAINQLPTAGEKAFAIDEIFGGEGRQMIALIEQGSAGMAKMRQEARDLGLVMSGDSARQAVKLSSAFSQVAAAAQQVVYEIGSALAGPALAAAKVIGRVASATIEWVKANQEIVVGIAAVGTGLIIAGAATAGVGIAIAGLGVVLGGLATGISVLGSIIGSMTTPFGLVAIAIAGGVALWLKFTESGQRAMGAITEGLGKMLGTFKETFGGVMDALKSGDLALAGQIAMAGLKVAFLQGVDALSKAVGGMFGDFLGKLTTQVLNGDLSGAWKTISLQYVAMTAQAQKTVVSIFASAARAVVDAWQGAVTSIANFMLDLASSNGPLGKVMSSILGVDMNAQDARKAAMDIKAIATATEAVRRAEEDLAKAKRGEGGMTVTEAQTNLANERGRLDAARREAGITSTEQAKQNIETDVGRLGDAGREQIDQLQAEANELLDIPVEFARQNNRGGSEAANEALRAAEAELARLREKAAQAAEEASRQSEAERDKAKNALAGVEANPAKIVGSFSAAALSAMGGAKSPMERMANDMGAVKRELERIAKETFEANRINQALLQEQRMGGVIN